MAIQNLIIQELPHEQPQTEVGLYLFSICGHNYKLIYHKVVESTWSVGKLTASGWETEGPLASSPCAYVLQIDLESLT